jgi:hypothetical protein
MQDSEPRALVERSAALPKLLSPRQASLRATGVVLLLELLVLLVFELSAMPMLSAFVLAGGLLVWVFRRRTAVHQSLAISERARELLDLGHIDEAEAQLDGLLRSRTTPANIRPFAAFYRALAAVRRGALDEADARLRAVIDSGWLGNRRSLQALAPAVYATAMQVAVLAGDLAAAERWRAEGQRCAANLERHWFVADVFLLARRCEWNALLRKLEQSWEAIEGTVSGTGIRQLRLLEAYALTRIGEHEDNYRGLHSGDEIAKLLHGVRPGRFDHLAARWPELREFMQAHRLLAE